MKFFSITLAFLLVVQAFSAPSSEHVESDEDHEEDYSMNIEERYSREMKVENSTGTYVEMRKDNSEHIIEKLKELQ